MSFPINSTSVITPVIERLGRVMQRSRMAKHITSMGVFNCRKVAGSDLWSAHAFGDAGDLMLVRYDRALATRVGRNVVRQARWPTIANRGRPLRGIIHVIFGNRQWIRGRGYLPYSGPAHDGHVHAAGSLATSRTPPCAR